MKSKKTSKQKKKQPLVSEIAHQISDGSLNSIIAYMLEKGQLNLSPVDFFPEPEKPDKVVNT